MKKVLMILTSNENLIDTDSKTGVWLGEFTEPYFIFEDKGYEITLASPEGGQPPVDPRSELTENITKSNRRFQEDEKARNLFEYTIPLNEIKAEDFDAVFFPGGHGPMGDLATDEVTAHLVIDFYRQQKPIAAICHGPAALITAAIEEPELLIDREVTAFSNAEEKIVGLRDHIPFSLEDRLKTLGAHYKSATLPFTAKIAVDGKLITGQNPSSADRAAQAMVRMLDQD